MSRFWKSQSLVSRTLLLTLLTVVMAQGISTSIWYTNSRKQEIQGITTTTTSMASLFASTVSYFQSLPVNYRHVILEQLRKMGGTRFFVSFNYEFLQLSPLPDNRMKQVAVNSMARALEDKLTNVKSIHVEFSEPDKLKILKNDIYLKDLPKSWAHYTLTLEPLNPPIMVVQIELDTEEWIYIAALLPPPYNTLEDTILPPSQWLYLLLSTALLLFFTYFMVRRQVRPLRNLAKAANQMSIDGEQSPLPEEGANELVTATLAFNRMQQRIRHYVMDREHLFSSISHDLKTPITRLRLRAELLENDAKRAKFNQDLDELEMMVKGALQCVHDTELHENSNLVYLNELLLAAAETHNQNEIKVILPQESIRPVLGKPLALKRVMTNLIDNGVKYGYKVKVSCIQTDTYVQLNIQDQGNGIPEEKLEAVFEPYVRLAKDKDGHGLGLGICRNILHAHGGTIFIHNILDNTKPTGLMVQVILPFNTESLDQT
ncbi:ATP-binding protein [Vibrio rumoiensis]|uniref:histidine kinase n=1 Tax=Vibrio rumoiensis 1S-45 TaxID=1188252 RepID=A0A1E5E3Q9_9VIBR|nr:ATP-binding protein [Vibrio rumoiensis]OEF26985.1 two-component sensor histidine kinase [Vibrio rumoiensis 1S-45]